MLTRNLSVNSGLVNGSRGVVVGFDPKGPVIQFLNQTETRIITPERFGIKLGNQMVFRNQFPLRLAWAMSIHKSQGMLNFGRHLTLIFLFRNFSLQFFNSKFNPRIFFFFVI
jgi:hypothetical protein